MSIPKALLKLSTSLFAVILFLPMAALAQTGTIIGTVTDENKGQPLPGANLRIEGTSIGTGTNAEGRYSLKSVPEGQHILVVSYLGYQTREIQITIEAGKTTTRNIALADNFVELDGIMVQGYRGGQASALNQQQAAGNIKNIISSELMSTFSDHNTAEVLERVPGVSLERDQGEGRYVQIRGTDPNLTSISINGEMVPSPEGDIRNVALDVIPSGMLSSIEVNKAITPDMDGNAIGGAVNLNTLQATGADPYLNITLGSGYNNQAGFVSPVNGQASASYGQRFGDEQRLGLAVGASYNVANRGTDNNENEWGDEAIELVELRDYNLTRTRASATANLDYRLQPGSRLYFSGMYNYFADQEYQGGMVVEPDVIERELKDRFEAQTISNIAAGGEHVLGDNFELNYRASYSYAQEDTGPENVNIYVQEYEDANEEAIEFMSLTGDSRYPRYSVIDGSGAPADAGPLSFSNYEQDEFEHTQELTTDQHFTSKVDMKTFYNLGDSEGEFKFGGLYRAKQKTLDAEKNFYSYGGNQTYSDLFGDYKPENFFQNQYEFGQYLDPFEVRDLFENERTNFEWDAETTFEDSRAEDYEGYEYTGAAYAMTEISFGDFTTIVGARYENTATDYTAHEVAFTEEGELIPEARELNGEKDFNFFLPMAHLKYTPTENLNLRLAWTNTFAKPNYFDLAPYQIVNREDDEIELGNPDLDPTRATNYDLMAEYYFSSVGIISVGAFYKDISDFRYLRVFEKSSGQYAGYEAEQPVNGGNADVAGIEFNLQQQLTFLPGFASGFGIYANYTYTWSEAEILGEDDQTVRTIELPGQAQDVANVALSYEKGGFSGRVSANYNSAYVDELINTSRYDRYYDEHLQIDISARQRLSANISLFAELMNITNEPVRYYHGRPDRPMQQEYYSFWGNAGVKLNF